MRVLNVPCPRPTRTIFLVTPLSVSSCSPSHFVIRGFFLNALLSRITYLYYIIVITAVVGPLQYISYNYNNTCFIYKYDNIKPPVSYCAVHGHRTNSNLAVVVVGLFRFYGSRGTCGVAIYYFDV